MGCQKRAFLFLQGCTSPFFTRLADRLTADGHRVFKVNFNMGDRVYWGARDAWDFNHTERDLPRFYRQLFEEYHFTDVIMLGDTRPVHRCIKPIAESFGAELVIFEEGYFRPNWLTMENCGINGFSRLPKDPQWYIEAARHLPDVGNGTQISNPTWLLAAHELIYHLPNALNPLFFPGYLTHRPTTSNREFAGWAKRFMQLTWQERNDKSTIQSLLDSNKAYFVLPLQLDSDAQIQVHSPINSMQELISLTVDSFAQFASTNDTLVIKIHPLDTGFVDYPKIIKQLSDLYQLDDRLIFLNSGHLPTLLHNAKGVVTVNSTVGTSALFHQCPTIALGDCVYNIEGLTFSGSLNDFWHNAEKPDRQLYNQVRKTIIHSTQINGGFYSEKGIEVAVDNASNRLNQATDPLTMLL